MRPETRRELQRVRAAAALSVERGVLSALLGLYADCRPGTFEHECVRERVRVQRFKVVGMAEDFVRDFPPPPVIARLTDVQRTSLGSY